MLPMLPVVYTNTHARAHTRTHMRAQQDFLKHWGNGVTGVTGVTGGYIRL